LEPTEGEKLRRASILVHLLGAVAAGALLAFWGLKLATSASAIAPPPPPPPMAREPDAALAARMFGDVGAAPASALNVQVSGVFAAGRASSAVISVDGKPPRAVLLGREVAPGVRLSEVQRDGVTLEQDGGRTQYKVPPATVAQASAPTETFRLEGATLTAPSIETPPGARPNPLPAPLPPAATMPGRNPDMLMPRRPGPPMAPPPQPPQPLEPAGGS
jgi:general secretion pathway protein C